MCMAVRKHTSPLRELTFHMASHSVTCHPAEVTSAFTPANESWYSIQRSQRDARAIVGLVTYRGGIPIGRQSPIQLLTKFNVEWRWSYDERRYHYAKPDSCVCVKVKSICSPDWHVVLGPTRMSITNSILIGSDVFAWLTVVTNRQTFSAQY